MPTALIIEDEPEANRLLSLLVQHKGYATIAALTGAEALERLSREPPEVALIDLMLPDFSGYEICQAIKSSRQWCRTPIIVITALIAEENRTRCLQLGALACLPKPYTPKQVFNALSLAEQWSKDLRQNPNHGLLALEADQDSLARDLSFMRCRLLAHSPLESESIAIIEQSLLGLARHALSWGELHKIDPVAQLDYRITEEQLLITVRDLGGWLDTELNSESAALADSSLERVFDTVERDTSDPILRLSLAFAP